MLSQDVCLSITCWYCIEMVKHIKLFCSPCRPTILVFTCQTLWRYSDGDPLLGALSAGGCMKKCTTVVYRNIHTCSNSYSWLGFYASARPGCQLEALCFHPVCSCVVRLSICSSITTLGNTIFWKWINRLWCQLAQVVYAARAWNDQLWGQEVKAQGHTRPKTDLEAWCRRQSRPLGLSSFSSS